MGFDITFHPISREELKRYIFEVIVDPRLAPARAAEITADAEKRETLVSAYSFFDDLRQKKQAGETEGLVAAYTFAAAALAGYLHPYWYERGACVSFLADAEPYFGSYLTSLHALAPAVFPGLADDTRGRITENYMGGGYVDHVNLPNLKAALHHPQYREVVEEIIGEYGLTALEHVITYCQAHSTGFLEATDIVVPMVDDCSSDADNLRAGFLENDGDHSNARALPGAAQAGGAPAQAAVDAPAEAATPAADEEVEWEFD